MRALLLIMLLMVAGCSGITGYVVLEEQTADPEVLFCPQDNCMDALVRYVEGADKIECAFMNIENDELEKALIEKGASVVVDDLYPVDFAKTDQRRYLMHDKFCVFDDSTVWTGSFNPTYNGDKRNNNNVIVLRSKRVAELYSDKFAEIWNGGQRTRSFRNKLLLNNKSLEVYFCPEDWCSNKIMDALEQAEYSIDFMAFSFTHNAIGDTLIAKHNEGVRVRGVMEKSQENKYTEYFKLKEAGIDVSWDQNPDAMHHKVFIIDRKKVITGSMNPSSNGEFLNDENIVIIEDKEVAKEFLKEFERVKRI